MFEPGRRSGPWLLLGAFAFLGLFAMHALDAHGMGHLGAGEARHPGVSAQASAGEAGSGSASDHHAMTSRRCDGSCAEDAGTADGPAGTGAGGGSALAMALCLAVLAAVAAMTILGRAGLRPSVLRPPGIVDRVSATLRSARGHDPPNIFSLSVQRC